MGVHLAGSNARSTLVHYVGPGSYVGGDDEVGTHALVLDDGDDRFVIGGDPEDIRALAERIGDALSRGPQHLDLE